MLACNIQVDKPLKENIKQTEKKKGGVRLSGSGTWDTPEMSALPQVSVLVDKTDILLHILPLFCSQLSCIVQHKHTKESQYIVLPSFLSVRSILHPLLKLCFKCHLI